MNASLSLRRRGHVERRVLRLIRGEQAIGSVRALRRPPPSIKPAQLAQFEDLRSLAAQAGIQIQPPGTPYVGDDELRLLGWIAECQRIAGREVACRSDHPLVRAIARCANALDASGMGIARAWV